MGRTTKFRRWFKVMKELIESDPDILEIMTDTDLHTYINGAMKMRDRISYSTFEKWKAPNNSKSIEQIEGVTPDEAKDFRDTLNYSRVCQKLALYREMKDPENKLAWKQQWIMERKYTDLRSNPQIQIDAAPVFKIEGRDEEQKALLDKLFNGTEVEEVDYEEIERKRLER